LSINELIVNVQESSLSGVTYTVNRVIKILTLKIIALKVITTHVQLL